MINDINLFRTVRNSAIIYASLKNECHLAGPYLVQITTGAAGVIRITQTMAK